MHLHHLSLTNFRNYARLELELPARIIVLQGENAQGKTNLLEAIYYLATTKSPLASAERQLIAWAAEAEVIPYARVAGAFHSRGREHSIEITLVREPVNGAAESLLRRQILLDGAARRALDVVGTLQVVLFLPEDIALVSGAPAERRHYLDVMLCQLDPLYCRSLSRYGRILTQRNALLKQIREGEARASELAYWDEQLGQMGGYVLARRLWAIAKLGQEVAAIHPALTGGSERLDLEYENSLLAVEAQGREEPAIEQGTDWSAEAAAPWQEIFRQALQKVRRVEIARSMTLVGPHRDDVRFKINGADATIYGSRGQQRTVALALKLAEVALMAEQTGEMPVLLLDDVLSELDRQRALFLLQTVSRAQQAILTTTDLHGYAPAFLEQAILWRVVAGCIQPWREGSA